MAGKQFGSYDLVFVVITPADPVGVQLCVVGSPYLPIVDHLVDYTDIETGVTTSYEVKTVTHDIVEIAAIPPDPPEAGSPLRHTLALTVRIQEL